jgi:pyridoxal phosphate enzyme (YggS family)
MNIADNYQRVLEAIARAAQTVGRTAADIRLVVVTKGHSLAIAQEAIAAGAHILGENYVEEAVTKILPCRRYSGVEWHMIGHVQSRKAAPVVEYFTWVHSVDSLKLASRLDRFAAQAGRRMPVLLECNVSGEASKYGFPAWQETGWTALLAELEQIIALPNVSVRGLMTMAPFLSNAEDARPYFHRLRCLRDWLAIQLPRAEWSDLSMGMSADYEVAIQEGATLVRIGTAILGERPKQVGGR